MDDLTLPVSQLNRKVDSLYTVVEHLNNQVRRLPVNDTHNRLDSLEQKLEHLSRQLERVLGLNSPSLGTPRPTRALEQTQPLAQLEAEPLEPASAASTATLQHKDVLVDRESPEVRPDYNCEDPSLSPETQVRRLTAQVTAAYNRIADLEEQLLSLRSLPSGHASPRSSSGS